MHHRDEVGEECAAVQLKELEQVLVGSDCLSVRINDVQKKKKKKKKSMCTERVCALEQMPVYHFFFFFSHFTCRHNLPQSASKQEEYSSFRLCFHFSHLWKAVYGAFFLFFFFTLAHHQLRWPLVKKKAAQRVETMQMEERTRPGGPRCALSAGERKKKKRTGERPP